MIDLLTESEDGSSGRCEHCKLVYGKERPENARLLRCPGCDLSFGDTHEAFRAVAMSLQNPAKRQYVNVYSRAACYVWLKVVKDFLDLGIEPLDADMFGRIPDWLEFELDQSGWDSIISPEHKFGLDDVGSKFRGSWGHWALHEGLCPGQPFLVEMLPPRWYRCSWEYEEYDVEYYWDIVARAPRSPKQAARAWEVWQKQLAEDIEERDRRSAEIKHEREHNVEAMYIQYDSFWSDRYDEMTPPDGYIVRLCSSVHHGSPLLEGRSPADTWPRKDREHPSQEKAWERLIENVKKHLPHLDPEAVRKLPSRYFG